MSDVDNALRQRATSVSGDVSAGSYLLRRRLSSSTRRDDAAIETGRRASASRDARIARDAARAIERDDIATVVCVRASKWG